MFSYEYEYLLYIECVCKDSYLPHPQTNNNNITKNIWNT